ncbi:MAG TPA: SEC-C metal-binding domain-containing protein [Myxococcota bacterium]|jgi:hypothetical protein|nr:SEC-C metal-binding domain-containing protein [Myxococcota bacterium]
MGHAVHYLKRLARVRPAEVDLGLALYRDAGLLRFLLTQVRLPESAARVALSLDDASEGPFLVVTRDGELVTCLGRGMHPTGLPVVTRGQLDSLSEKVDVLRARVRQARAYDQGRAHKDQLLARLWRAGDALSREEMMGLMGLAPLLAPELLDELVKLSDKLDALRPQACRVRRARAANVRGLRAYWSGCWALGHLAVLLTSIDGPAWRAALGDTLAQAPAELTGTVVATGVGGLALRGAWAMGRVGGAALGACKRALAAAGDAAERFDAALALGAIGVRHAKHRAEARKALDGSAEGAALAGALAAPEDEAAALLEATRAQGVPDELAAAAWASHHGDPLNDEDHRGMALRALAVVARARPEELYFPQAWLDAHPRPWTPALSLGMLARVRAARRGPRPYVAGPRPGRNDPCPCDSGRKFKRCHELGAGRGGR